MLLDRDARGEHVVSYQIAAVYEALGNHVDTFAGWPDTPKKSTDWAAGCSGCGMIRVGTAYAMTRAMQRCSLRRARAAEPLSLARRLAASICALVAIGG
ncbi:MAG: hypothetical protein M3468_02985 [Acidobacteriota bacterium]|nr:hypothetical protein [Acidobacteriota bacterium]